MSAFIVDKAHIDALVTAGLEMPGQYGPLRWFEREFTAEEETEGYAVGEVWGPGALELARRLQRELTAETAGRVGAMLWAENRRSVNHRYAEEEWEEPYLFDRLPGRPDPVAVLAAIDGYEYQSCEHPGWSRSEAHAFVEALRGVCIRALPGYSAASTWHITSRDVFLPAAVAPMAAPAPVESWDRNDAIREIRQALRRRSGKAWSVTGGRGTAWGWITITAPPARRDGYAMTAADMLELGQLLGLDRPAHCQGVDVAASSEHRAEYVARARGEAPTVHGQQYWD